ncbi:16S ribosomal RNA methyltransferase A [Haloferax mediterranei ATCC 33500]|uniref:Probable ribosomal RNA small subunit methyltransferase A n=1 Tax=Haloferax mediterranei (strain ATCC 33500 / DSM 1411 / JCM 8866 / NBRC 14739 / NCIMB 2177 / R-4) TaxID=523841 RepID=I3R874_HALMT|nr:16S ribosomal RNA methyltransferase A [Haloferax mediterranei]AFK20434.1 dimethyladenosine transferase [Haloferax mediterranei ATCC 33500]AHZ23796.1 16S rRNA methyltransferase [Haloferax mediterranei ATCC 33500]ELZ98218.1 16S ribosomal RNA methyltransferase KsgA/Dim1 family protein [Haloferax mediterranei ATCC 33500]MDX5986810.1 16S ribosomal RNA methyltransferase A [Haloferax mediterranei ATCC 33500]QCQ76134.1 16S ribosomal RNA methyltransferase A [Haloferax mediterranei ATCC 33500]
MTSDGSEQVREAAARDPDALIRRAGVRGDPDRDQHFLVDDRVVDRIPTYLPDDTDHSHVLEIGGGPGVLTDRLLAVADRVTVVEQDRTFADHLRREFSDPVEADRLTVIEGDALEADLPEFTACVSNLPYGISSEISFRLLPRGKPLVLMFQKEFGERMAAESGTSEYGRLSVSAQHYGDVEVCEIVPREAFDPKPAVQSAIVRVTPRDPDYEVDNEEFFFDFVKALFTQRRKTIRNGIRNTSHISGLSDPEAVVEAADEDVLRKRAGNMAPAEFAELAQLAASVGL